MDPTQNRSANLVEFDDPLREVVHAGGGLPAPLPRQVGGEADGTDRKSVV